jgi:4-hydroxy-4-methyl-2-oxoglutarate aldolase
VRVNTGGLSVSEVSVFRSACDGATLLGRARSFPAATLHEAAGRVGALPSGIKPVYPEYRIAGPAFTVRCPPGHNLAIHYALLEAKPGDVPVVDVGDGFEFGYWGEVLSEAAKARGLSGVVIHGCVRDKAEIGLVGFPVFSTGLCIRGTGKATEGAALGEPIWVGDVRIQTGDLVVGDVDGVVVLESSTVSDVLDAAAERTERELQIIQRLRDGESTVDIYDLEQLGV